MKGLQHNVLDRPAGPVAARFITSLAPMCFIMGPVGSGKTTASVGKCINVARLQPTSIVDGVRKARVCAVRTTYRGLWESLLPSYWKVFPQGLGKWNGGKGDPADHFLQFNDPRFGRINLHMMFRAIGEHSIEDFVRGLEVNAFWLNEPDLLPPDCLGYFAQRCGRGFLDERPKDPETGEPIEAFSPVFGDFNAPDEENWLIKRKEQNRDSDEFLIQPSGFSPDAENIHNLGKGWYERQRALMEDWEIKRFLENRIGFSRTGEPVYVGYNPDLHDIGKEAQAEPNLPLVIGVDGGARAAAVIGQKGDDDCITAFDELVTPAEQVTDPRSFGVRVAEFLHAHYPDHVERNTIVFVVDPANMNDGKVLTDPNGEGGYSWGELFHLGAGTIGRLVAGRTNDPDVRQGQVRAVMRDFAPGHPRLRMTKRCVTLRRGMAGAYKLARQKLAGGDIVYRPVKSHPVSDVQDALQYLTVYFTGVVVDRERESGFSGVRNRRRPHAPSATILPFAA